MKAAAILFAGIVYFQWISSFSLTIPSTTATSYRKACQSYEFYDPMDFNSTSAYTVCKNVILQPGKQLSISVPSDNVKYIVFKNNIIPILPLGTFSSFVNLTYLYLNHNGVKTLIPGLFTYLTELQELHLQDNSITEISTGTFNSLTNLKVLDLSRNAIMTLGRGCLTGLVNLKSLNLNRNKLYYLERETFVSLTKLEVLDLSYNNLSIPEQFFAIEIKTENLKKLLINNNLLLHFPIFLTGNLDSFELLDVSYNALTKIDFESILPSKIANFSNNQISAVRGWPKFNNTGEIDLQKNKIKYDVQITGEIIRLDLKWNELEFLDSFMFNTSLALKELDLGHNFINEIADNVFQGLTSIQTLRLNNNRLTYLPARCFVGLDYLELLTLSHNSLRILEDGVFNGLSKLTGLYLDYNKLVSINEKAFHALYNLRYLYLNNNLLTTIKVPLLLDHLPNLNKISFSNNNWNCSELLGNTEAVKKHSAELSQKCTFDSLSIFELACDNFHLQVYSHSDSDNRSVHFLTKVLTSFTLLFVLIIDLVLITWYFIYLRITLRQSRIKMIKFEHVLTTIRSANRDDVYFTIL